MKHYSKNLSEKFQIFLKLDTVSKLKKILKILGVKYIVYNILYLFLSKLVKSKIYFIKGIVFDSLKHINELIIIKTDFNEKFILFANDNIISKEMFINEKFDLEKFEKALKFINQKKKN